MRRETKAERAAWTALIDGSAAPAAVNKYGNERAGKYASKHEADTAGKLHALAAAGAIHNLEEQKRIVLVPSNGKLRAIVYVADFHYVDKDGKRHVVDAKGFKTQVYRLKKRMAALLLNVTIEEV